TSGAASRFEAQHTTRLTPLLGRDDEIEVLSRRWRDATQGEGRVVVLTGEPGIGKSRIALAFQERLQAEPHIRLRYHCSAHHTNSALFPFIGQLERAARFERGDAPAEKLAKLEALLMQSGVNAVHSVPILANLLLGITALYVLLCRALLLLRQPEAALEVTEQGLATAVYNTERIFEAELYRLKARALLARGGSNARTSARPLLDQALMTASSQHARSLELRAATDLAALAID